MSRPELSLPTRLQKMRKAWTWRIRMFQKGLNNLGCVHGTYDITSGTLKGVILTLQLNGRRQLYRFHANPDLFKIITPINIIKFKDLLKDHPNQPFVQSVCDGLRYGFWPWAETTHQDYPEELDLSRSECLDPTRLKFFTKQLSIEQHKERYSASFGSQLLPGMYCMPIYAVPKPHSENLRLVTDHSASKHSLNGMIDHASVTGYPMDNLAPFGEKLVAEQRVNSDLLSPHALTVWKSDIEAAYLLCPVHPVWQVKQATQIDGQFYIDRCIVFGSSASPAIFIAFNSLVTT